MTAWVDANEFGTESAPLPQENVHLAPAAVAIGVVSFAVLLLP